MCRRQVGGLCCVLLVLAAAARLGWAGEAYVAGGALAGVKLARFPAQHGEEPGHPGCIPELMANGGAVEDMGNAYCEWGPQGQAPELDLYPGSAEHWRAYMFKYMPVRSFFDRQSQRKRFTAPALAGAVKTQAEQYAEPVYWVPRHADPRPTGRFRKPIAVVRMRAGSPVLKLDLGELPMGLYVVRVVGAVETSALRPFREPLFLRMTVNDGPSGEPSAYRLRLGYCDQFYSVAEVYFHSPERRHYRAELAVDRGSTVDLLVRDAILDDVLAGTARRRLKTRTTLGPPLVPDVPAELGRDERLRRDAALWRGFPPLNAQGSSIAVGRSGYGTIGGVSAGTGELSGEAVQERHGAWVPWGRATRGMVLADGLAPEDVLLANPKLGLVYTLDDLRHNRLLPDPYPLKDDGAGLYFPDPDDPAKGRAWTPIGVRVHRLYGDYYRRVGQALQACAKSGKYDDAHDAAVTLVRWAYAFPTLDFSRYLSNAVHESGPFGRDLSCRRRATAANFLPHYQLYVKPILFHYDRLYDFIAGNRLLAESVGRFVPWVKTPADVTRLLDVYLVQTTAKRILRYHYHTDPMDIANLATVVGDPSVTDPWMEWLFARTFIYPLPVAGIQDVMISGTTREGTEFVGSTYYAQGEGALRVAEALDRYRAAGGSRRFDLSDPARYPKPVAHAWWRIENVVGGWDFLRIGDVCGPDKVPGHTLRNLGFARAGWRWTRDPKFAFILKHYVGREGFSDKAWQAIAEAAAKCPRAPWLDNGSRVLPMWAGILEAGTEHDDPRLRRAAYVRIGHGMGHHHDDTLDLQVVAHGLPMTIDGGQRPGYSSPADRTSRVHNTVEVGGRSHRAHSWLTALADCPGARYLAATADPPPGARLFRRQIALIDADDDGAPRRLHAEQQKPFSKLAPLAKTRSSYVFDVFRVEGGNRHTYCFHGPLHDDFQWNAQDPAPPKQGSDEADYLRIFKVKPELSGVGAAPDTFEATWRMALEVPGPGAGEKEMLGKSYDPQAARKCIRLHLLGARGLRAMRGQFVCRRWNYEFTNVMVGRRIAQGEREWTVFPAVIEPYAGEPFIASTRLLAVGKPSPVPGKAVAVEVKTTNGPTDVCFADADAGQTRTMLEAKLEVAGEFAFVSTDDQGLRQATLVGGTVLRCPSIRIEVRGAERRARVVRVDYPGKKLWIDQAWPRRSCPMVFEVGLPGAGHMTTYTAVKVEPSDDGSLLRLQRGADYYRSEITALEPGGVVRCTLKPLCDYIAGKRRGWVASDESRARFWRAEHLGGMRFKLTGTPVSPEAFGEPKVLRLWEYGVGDVASQRTSVSLRRLDGGRLELVADAEGQLSVRGGSAESSADGQTWAELRGRASGGWFTFTISAEMCEGRPLLLRVRQ